MPARDLSHDHVRIRMYRQGLGDCFLLTIPEKGSRAHILIDCGVLKGTEDAQPRIQRVAENIRDETEGKLDVLVVTHEHWDHVSGFLQARDVFDKLSIAQVWLAWTERPDDDLAIELRQRKARTLRAVAEVAGRLRGSQSFAARRSATRLDGLLQFYGEAFGVAGRRTTAQAMQWAKERERATVRFLYPERDILDVPAVANVRAFVLGPPWNRSAIGKSRPSKAASEVYELAGDAGPDFGFLAAMDARDGGAENSQTPFDKWFCMSRDESVADDTLRETYWGETQEWRRIEDDWLDTAGRLALHLDSDTNNTSLVLAFELRQSGRVLLFPGDAQVGNWLSWEPLKWSQTDGRTVTAGELLARTVFYKVGHHGSHNATLREKGLELMASDELAVMIPVDRDTAGKMEWNMPFPPLFERLQQKARGRVIELDRGVPASNPGMLGEAQWRNFIDRTAPAEDWIDYFVPL